MVVFFPIKLESESNRPAVAGKLQNQRKITAAPASQSGFAQPAAAFVKTRMLRLRFESLTHPPLRG
jgi:hypothetical protein